MHDNPVAPLDALFGALAKARKEIANPSRTKINPHFKSKYAPLEECHNALKPLADHGLAYMQTIRMVDEGLQALTIVGHESGQHYVTTGPVIPLDKKNAHGVVSATTYAKRVALCACFGLEGEEDEDGNAANKSKKVEKEKVKKEPYPADKFAENVEGWKTLLEAGTKRPSDIISTIQVRYSLSEQQLKEISSLGGES